MATDAVFCFAVLSAGRGKVARAANDPLLGSDTLGIEITDAALAARCELGNLDPQHGLHPLPGVAAIDLALTLEPLPPLGARLVTLRADADALGAFAVLALRAQGCSFDEAAKERIEALSRLDRHDRGPWRAWAIQHPPLTRPTGSKALVEDEIPAMAMALTARDDAVPLENRIAAIADWLLTGHIPQWVAEIAVKRHQQLINAWNDGEIVVEPGSVGWIALVRSSLSAGLQLGYRIAPVVIAETLLPAGRKLTIAQFEPGWFDCDALLRALNQREDRWGGQANILGSPQGRPSSLSLEEAVELVTTYGGSLARDCPFTH